MQRMRALLERSGTSRPGRRDAAPRPRRRNFGEAWERGHDPRGICSTSATRRCDDAKFKLLASDDPNLEPLWETFEI